MDVKELLKLKEKPGNAIRFKEYLNNAPINFDYLDVTLKLVNIYLQAGNITEATNITDILFNNKLKKDQEVYYLNKYILFLLNNNFLDIAKEKLEEVYNKSSDKFTYHTHMATYASKNADVELEIKHLEAILACDITLEEEYRTLNKIIEKYFASRDFEKYLEHVPRFKQVCKKLKLDEIYTSCLYNEGFIYFKESKTEEAIKCFSELNNYEVEQEFILKANNMLIRLYLEECNYKKILKIKKDYHKRFMSCQNKKIVATYNELLKETYSKIEEEELKEITKELEQDKEIVKMVGSSGALELSNPNDFNGADLIEMIEDKVGQSYYLEQPIIKKEEESEECIPVDISVLYETNLIEMIEDENTYNNQIHDNIKVLDETFNNMFSGISKDVFENLHQKENNHLEKESTTEAFDKLFSMKDITSSLDIEAYLEYLHHLFIVKPNMKKRDIIRELGQVIQRYATFGQFIVVNVVNHQGYEYKQGRVYDRFFLQELFAKSPFSKILLEEKNIIIRDVKNSFYNIELISGKHYSQSLYNTFAGFCIRDYDSIIRYVIGFYLHNEDLKNENIYNLMHFSAVLEMYINMQENYYNIENKKQSLESLIDNQLGGLKVFKNDVFSLSKKAQDLFLTSELLEKDVFIGMLDQLEASKYDDALRDAIQNGTSKCIYQYYNKEIEEIMFRNHLDEIYCLVINKTEENLKMKNVLSNLYTDEVSGIQNRKKMMLDLNGLMTKYKFSVIMLEINDFKIYEDLYGYEFVCDLIKALGVIIDNYASDKNINAYHLGGALFAYVLESAIDKRTLVSFAIDMLKKLEDESCNISKRVRLTFSCGIAKYSKEDNLGLEKFLSFAIFALKKAQEESRVQSVIKTFSLQEYKRAYYEQGLVTYISEAIDTSNLIIHYKQVVNVKASQVEYYEAYINVTNYLVDDIKMQEVIEKRNMNYYIDTYLISKVLEEMYNLYKQTGKLTRICLKIHRQSLNNTKFIPFVASLIRKYGLPKEVLIMDVVSHDYTIEEKKMLYNLSTDGYSVMTNNMDVALDVKAKYFRHSHIENIIDNKKQTYIVQIKSFLENYDIKFVYDECAEQDLKVLKQLGVTYIGGSAYKKIFLIQDLIRILTY